MSLRPVSLRCLALAVVLPVLLCGAAMAQQANIAFGGLKGDTSAPVEVLSDSFTVSQTDNTAVFTGNVVVSQGEMRLTATEILVEYGADGKGIARLLAKGGVVLANAADAAEAREAIYTIATGEVIMTGDVLLTQGQAAMSGQKLVIDLKSGTGRMEGRVTTTFTPGNN